ncbi:hypothetical protein D9611_013405 [Ephemerocybe angulata]|uniref:DUF6533 domain-containing protein n=1 Tax=Ephemerocybe angulata TaxID=980116 RepID=A0A8H5FB32_9AGAR|nr:hypothetical protein D9611_013405 [Tulosesus angulatus]
MTFHAAQADPETLFKIAQCGKNEAYLLAWALMLIIADWAHTFQTEVEHMWFAPMSVVKVLFFFNRYNILDIALSFVHTTGASIPSQCKKVFFTASIWLVVSIACAEAIMYMRVFALSGKSKIVLIVLSTQFILVHGGSIVLLAVFLRPMQYEASPLPKLLPCLPVIEDDDILISIFFGIVMLSEFLIFAYTGYIGYKKYQESTRNSTLLKIFYRDGVFYFGALFVASTANIIILFTVLPTCRYMFNIPQRALHSILASRTILHLKEQSSQRLVEYDSHGQPPGRYFNSHSNKSHGESQGQSFVLSEFRAAPTPVRHLDSQLEVETAFSTGTFDIGEDKLARVAPFAHPEDVKSNNQTSHQAFKLAPLRRDRAQESPSEEAH